MSLRVVKAGLFTTVQDNGRFGWQSQGVGPSGAMDLTAMRVANALVGNDESAAVLECTLLGPVLQVEDDAIVALTGAPADTRIDGAPVAQGHAVFVPAGTEITVGHCTRGCRTTLAIAGGVATTPVLGSRSSNARAHFGGFNGRALRAGDQLPVGPLSDDACHLRATLRAKGPRWVTDDDAWPGDLTPSMGPEVRVRAIPTDAFAELDDVSQKTMFSLAFHVGPRSDRMGYRLEGPTLLIPHRREMISEGVAWGAIQVPPDGHPIILGADRPTTGGYPVIAHVASVDRSAIAQLRPGDRVRFGSVSLAQAEEAWAIEARLMADAIAALRYRRVEARRDAH